MSVQHHSKNEQLTDKCYANATKRYVTLIEEVLLLVAQYSYHFNQQLQTKEDFAQKLLIALLLDVVNLVQGHVTSFRDITAQAKQEESLSSNNNSNNQTPASADQGNKK